MHQKNKLTRRTYNCAHLRSTKESLTFEYLEKEICLYILKKVEIWSDVTIAGRTDTEQTNEQGKIELLNQWTKNGYDEQCWPNLGMKI